MLIIRLCGRSEALLRQKIIEIIKLVSVFKKKLAQVGRGGIFICKDLFAFGNEKGGRHFKLSELREQTIA